jgi:4-amino-4-deoxy-L-arabinose transferase-like glycosyltransferase
VPIYSDPAEAYWLDSKDYDGLADRMLQGQAYTGIASDPVELFRTPVYPAFLALVYRLGGRDLGNVALAQLILGGLSTLILFSMMRAFVTERVAVGLCCLYALDPSSTFWATNVMSETLFTFAVVLVLYALGRWWASGSWLWAAAAGGIAGIATLVRPIGEVLLPVWLAFVVWRSLGFSVRGPRSVRLTRSRWGSGWICFTVAAALVLVPYMLYNERVWGTLTISSVDTYNLGRYHAAPLLAETQDLNLEAALTSLRVSILPQADDRSRFLSVIRAYPWAYTKMFAKGDLIVLFWPEYHRWFGLLDINFTTRGALAELEAGRWLEGLRSLVGYAAAEPLTGIALLLTVGYQIVLYGLAARGFVRSLRLTPRSASAALWVSLVAATALALLLTPGPVGEQRFRVPAQPGLILLAAHGWATPPAEQACERAEPARG